MKQILSICALFLALWNLQATIIFNDLLSTNNGDVAGLNSSWRVTAQFSSGSTWQPPASEPFVSVSLGLDQYLGTSGYISVQLLYSDGTRETLNGPSNPGTGISSWTGLWHNGAEAEAVLVVGDGYAWQGRTFGQATSGTDPTGSPLNVEYPWFGWSADYLNGGWTGYGSMYSGWWATEDLAMSIETVSTVPEPSVFSLLIVLVALRIAHLFQLKAARVA